MMTTSRLKIGDRLFVHSMTSPFAAAALGEIIRIEAGSLPDRVQYRIERIDRVCQPDGLTLQDLNLRIEHGLCRLEPDTSPLCGCGHHHIDPAGDVYAQHRRWAQERAPIERALPLIHGTAYAKGVGVSARGEAAVLLVDDQYEV